MRRSGVRSSSSPPSDRPAEWRSALGPLCAAYCRLTRSDPTTGTRPVEPEARRQPAARIVVQEGASGVVLAIDRAGLVTLARQADGVIEFVPNVGDFLAVGEPLFMPNWEDYVHLSRTEIRHCGSGRASRSCGECARCSRTCCNRCRRIATPSCTGSSSSSIARSTDTTPSRRTARRRGSPTPRGSAVFWACNRSTNRRAERQATRAAVLVDFRCLPAPGNVFPIERCSRAEYHGSW